MPWFRSLAALALWAAVASAADWPQWLGPDRDGASPEVVAPWKEAPKVVWRQPVGEGHGGPVVAGGRVVVHALAKAANEEEVVAFDAASGKELWRHAYPRAAFRSPFGVGPRATPAVADGRVYALGVTGLLTCLDAAKGERAWQVDTLKEFGAPNLKFGVSCSPLVETGKVYVNVGAKGASVVAFDTDKGTVSWKALDDGASYASPVAFGEGAKRQVVFLTQKGLVGLDPAKGAVLWQSPLVDLISESSTTPVRAGGLLLASSVTVGSVALKLEEKDGKWSADTAWKNAALNCYFSTPVPTADQEHVFFVTGSNPLTLNLRPEATLRCVETKTGKETWNRPRVGTYHASLMRTGDGKFLLLEERGDLVLIEPSTKEYKELARARVCGETWVHPALAGGRLYVRDRKELICLELGRP